MEQTAAMIDHLLRVAAMFALEAAVKGTVYAAIAIPFFAVFLAGVAMLWLALRADR